MNITDYKHEKVADVCLPDFCALSDTDRQLHEILSKVDKIIERETQGRCRLVYSNIIDGEINPYGHIGSVVLYSKDQ